MPCRVGCISLTSLYSALVAVGFSNSSQAFERETASSGLYASTSRLPTLLICPVANYVRVGDGAASGPRRTHHLHCTPGALPKPGAHQRLRSDSSYTAVQASTSQQACVNCDTSGNKFLHHPSDNDKSKDDDDASVGDVTEFGPAPEVPGATSATPPQLHSTKPTILDTLWSKLLNY